MLPLIDDILQGARVLRRERRYALAAIVTMAIGIAATTTMTTVVREVLLAPLAYPHADRIAVVETRQENRKPFARVAGGDFVDLARDLHSVEALAYYFGGDVGVQFGDRASFVTTSWTTAELFRIFSLAPTAGRILADGAADEAVVNEGFAVRMFGSRAGALGRRLSVENRPYTIVGVVPASFQFPHATELWMSAPATPENLNRTAYNYRAVARVRSDVAVAAAQEELALVAGRLERAHPVTNRRKTLVLVPLRDFLVGDMRPTLYLLLASVFVLLLIACANVANLQLARGTARSRELAIRGALGAGRLALARATIAESVVLGLVGAAAGGATAAAATAVLARWAPPELPRAGDIGVDGVVLATAAVVAVATGLVASLAPARQVARLELSAVMREQGERSAGGTRSTRMRQILVAAEIGLAFVLALTATLLVRSVGALERVDLGFRPEGVLVMYAHEPARTDAEYDRALARLDEVVDRARALPGVTSAAAVMGLPAGRYGSNGSYAIEGRQQFVPGARLPEAEFSLASPGYVAAIGMRLERGRDFSTFDRADSLPVVIVSESVAREQFGNEDPLGHRVMCGLDSPAWMTIVGVVGDVRHTPGAPAGPELYMPLAQHKFRANELEIVVRSDLAPEALAASMRAAAAAVDPDMAVGVTTLDAMLREATVTPRVRMLLLGVFGAIALLLAVSGVYGVTAYTVLQRTREFAIRAALGARPADVLRHVLVAVSWTSVPALAVGALVAALASRAIRALLFGVTPLDPLAYGATAAVVLGASLAAAAVPAWRAMRVDPAKVLK